MVKPLRMFLKVLITLVIVAIIALIIYIIYLQAQYKRIPDKISSPLEGTPAHASLEANTPYTALSYNIGFGAYTPDYTFFMDEGIMADGTKTRGSHGRAVSKQSVETSIDGVISAAQAAHPDFALFQEVDTDATRSFHVNQVERINQAFGVGTQPGFASIFASNFHSAYLAYPIPEMHGIVNAGLLTLSNTAISSATRRSYPVDESFPTKFFDLDRCFEVLRIPVSNGKELVLINSHMSAYDKGGTIRARQLALLNDVLASEAKTGNYVIAGGDWNHALCDSLEMYPSKQQVPPWVAVMDASDVADGFSIVRANNIEQVPSCRGDDIPYEKGTTYTTTVDGFIVSSNVQAQAQNIDTDFAYSDHNPVKLTFSLQD